MIYNTTIEIITSNQSWTSFRYKDYDGLTSRDSTRTIRQFMEKDQLNVVNPEKLK